MSVMRVCRNAWPANGQGDEVINGPNSFEGTFVSIAGQQLFVGRGHNENTLYAVAIDVVLSCDGTTAAAASLTAGRRIRVTTAKSDPNLVIRVEWLHTYRCFTAIKNC